MWSVKLNLEPIVIPKSLSFSTFWDFLHYYAKFGDIFQESIKQQIQSLQQCASKNKNRFIWKPILSKGTSSRHLFIIYSQAK